MPHFTLPLDPQAGPLISVNVGVSHARRGALTQFGFPVPDAVHARALVDTGASLSSFSPSILKQLNLSPTGTISLHTPSTGTSPQQVAQYDVSIVVFASDFHAPLIQTTVPITANDYSSQGIDGLIGRDILRDCLLVYNGMEKTFSLAW